MTQEHGVIRVVASVRRRLVAVGALVAAVATAPGASVLGAATHSVDFTIVANENKSNRTMNLNGYGRGAMTITIPVGWQVVVHFENVGAMSHSLAVLPSGAHQQGAAAAPAFPGAATTNFAAGLPKGSKETFTFDASKAGTYELVCGVQGHAAFGQWDTLIVSATADAPSVTPADAVTFTVK